MTQLEKEMQKTARNIDSLKNKMNALSAVKTPTQDYKDVSKQIADAEKKQAALNDRMEKFVELGGKTNSKQYKSMQYDAAELENTIAYAKGELQDLVDTGKAFTLGNTTAEFNSLSQQLGDEQAHLSGLSNQYSQLQEKVKNISSWKSLAVAFNKVKSVAKSAFLAPISGMKKAAGAAKTLTRGLNGVANGLKKAASFGVKTVGALSGLSGLSKVLGGTIGGLGKRIFSLAKTAFVFGVLRRAFTSLRTGAQESFGTYLKYDSELKTSINGLKAQLSALKGSLASAFAPIISAVVPYLSTLISWVTTAANVVAAFIATLSGKTSYKKAVANVGAVGAAADDAAGSLGNAKDAAEDLEKALGKYDDLNVIDQPKSSSGGSGGSGGGAGAGDITYEDVEIDSAISDFAEKVKEAWKTADFTEVGTIIGEKLKDSLDKIPWEDVKEKASKVGSSLATFINGAIEVEGLGNSIGVTLGEAINTGIEGLKTLSGKLHWSSVGTFVSEGISGTLNTIEWNDLETTAKNLGSGLADALNKIMTPETFGNIGSSFASAVKTVVEGAYTFVTDADWGNWGSTIASAINKFFEKFDWKKAGLTFSGAVTGIINTLSNAIKGTEWDEIGNEVWNAIATIKWSDIANSFFDVVGTAFGGLAAFIGGFISDAFSNIGQYFDEKTKESGGDIIAGIFKGIKEAIVNIGSWIVDNIFTPFINGFKEAFGIHSPSTVMEEQGGYIIDGLLNGLLNAVAGIKEWIVTNILTPIKDALDTTIEVGVGLVKSGWKTVTGWLDSLGNAAKSTISVGVSLFKSGWKTVTGWLGDAKNTVLEIAAKIKTKASELWDDFKNTWNSSINAVLEIAAKVKTKASELWENVCDGWEDIIDKVLEVGVAIKNAAKDWWNSVVDFWEKETENKSIEAYVKVNPGALGEGAETPEIEVKITGDNESLKKTVKESAEYLNETLPNETSVEVNVNTDNFEQKLKKLSTSAQITITASLNGFDPTTKQKLEVIAEVTGTDYSKLPVSEKYINDMYANIIKAYPQSGVTLSAPMSATSLANGGQTLYAPMKANSLNNNGQTVTAPMKANSLDNNGKTVTAPIKASKVSGDGKTIKAPIKASKITNSKTVSSKVKVTGFTNTPTLKAKVKAVDSMWSRNSAVGGVNNHGIWSNLPQKALGGILQSNFWRNIPAYAAGGNPHGTMFVAGEAGPEIVGHIGGRTEVLNKSQIASAIYSAVSDAMREAIYSLGYSILQNMAECTNMVIANMANIVDAIYKSGNLTSGRNVQFAGMPVSYTVPDTNKVSIPSGGSSGTLAIDYDRLAGAVAKRISGNIEIRNNMTLDGRVVYDKMVSLNRAYIKQTGRSAFER